jgi:uncharacterized protein DUF2154
MKTRFLWIAIWLLGALLLVSCSSDARVGALQNESQSVELGSAKSVRVEINQGAGDLKVTGGAAKLLEADFNYNVAKLKPEVAYTHGMLIVRQPDVSGLPVLRDIGDFRNEWGLRLQENVPMDLSVEIGGGTSDLQLADLSLTRLAVTLGAGTSTLDLNGDWTRDLDVSINASAADMTVLLPSDVGVRMVVDPGAAVIEAPGFHRDGGVYTNAAYGLSGPTLHVDLKAGIGRIGLELVDP